MKNLKKIMAVAIVAIMMMALGATAFAASITIKSQAPSGEADTETTEYSAWMLLNADIETAPTQSGATQSDGKVAYYTTSTTAKAALENAGLFTFTQVGTQNKWYATPKTGLTAKNVTDAFKDWTDAQMTAAFGNPYTGAQTVPGGEAKIDCGDDGYYFVKSTLGDQIAVQTIGDVKIDTKNTYPTDEKTVDETDKHAQVGDEITFTLTVNVPASANDVIVLTDTMTQGLTFKSVDSIQADGADVTGTVAPNTAEAVTANNNKFTITFDAATVKANQGKTITITYTAVLNNKAMVGVPEINTLDLKYGNDYTAVPKQVQVETHGFVFTKVDGSTPLTGAEFELRVNNTAIPLVKRQSTSSGELYWVATSEDSGAVTTITTTGVMIAIGGLDSDVTYQLVETKAPAGYNEVAAPVDVTPNTDNALRITVQNNKGSVLPSTGGTGTTVLYIVGALLVVGAGVALVTKKRVG